MAVDLGGLQHFHVVVEDGGAYVLRQQHAGDDLTIAAKAGNDDGRFLLL